MPRRPRILVDDACYHILTRGNNRAPVFFEDADRQRYGRWLLELSQEHGVRVYHYCLMPNHVHLVLRATQGTELRQMMQRLNLSYAHYVRRTYDHVGHLWQDRFKSLPITEDRYLLQCGSYIELNPVRAKLVEEPAAYPWSSYRAYAYGHEDPLVSPSPVFVAMGQTAAERQARYRTFVLEQLRLPEKIEPVPFSRPRGRPRKKEPVLFSPEPRPR